MEATSAELPGAVALLWRYNELVSEGVSAMRLSRLPASPPEIERAVSVVLAAVTSPSGRSEIVRVCPRDAKVLLDPGTPRLLETILSSLPEFLPDELADLQTELFGTLLPDGTIAPPAKRPSAVAEQNPERIRRWHDLQSRRFDETSALLQRARAATWRSTPTPSAPTTGAHAQKSGCLVLIVLVLLATVGLAYAHMKGMTQRRPTVIEAAP